MSNCLKEIASPYEGAAGRRKDMNQSLDVGFGIVSFSKTCLPHIYCCITEKNSTNGPGGW